MTLIGYYKYTENIYRSIFTKENDMIYEIYKQNRFNVNQYYANAYCQYFKKSMEINDNVTRAIVIKEDLSELITYLSSLESLIQINKNIFFVKDDIFWFDVEKIYDYLINLIKHQEEYKIDYYHVLMHIAREYDKSHFIQTYNNFHDYLKTVYTEHYANYYMNIMCYNWDFIIKPYKLS